MCGVPQVSQRISVPAGAGPNAPGIATGGVRALAPRALTDPGERQRRRYPAASETGERGTARKRPANGFLERGDVSFVHDNLLTATGRGRTP